MDYGKNLGRYEGVVVQYNVTKAFGFVELIRKITEVEVGNGTKRQYDVIDRNVVSGQAFVYYTSINCDGFKKLIEGQVVEFNLHRNNRGLNAQCVDVTDNMYDESGDFDANNVENAKRAYLMKRDL